MINYIKPSGKLIANKISNNKYISDGKLRDMTKEFIIQKCKLSKEEVNNDYGNKR